MLSHSILVWVFNFSLWVFLNGKLCLIGVFLAFICIVVAMEVLLVRVWNLGGLIIVVDDEAVIRHTWVELELKQIHVVGICGWGSVCETIDGELLEYSSHNQMACGSISDGLVKTSSALVGTLLKTYQRSGGAGSALASAVCAAPAAAVA
ncbi:hypothetical protein C5167_048330 [Papaver somniferum]|uniref:Autophagy-related protein 2 n=1 Tax=Papaver somniferum TaxID=3469 RepID=A0A4Y7KKZ4_PAPSO|nr:hypothetical protein C5167_048330 [Papaver somniferum]